MTKAIYSHPSPTFQEFELLVVTVRELQLYHMLAAVQTETESGAESFYDAQLMLRTDKVPANPSKIQRLLVHGDGAVLAVISVLSLISIISVISVISMLSDVSGAHLGHMERFARSGRVYVVLVHVDRRDVGHLNVAIEAEQFLVYIFGLLAFNNLVALPRVELGVGCR
eukprot:6198415-Pleurochrysis_carterae.AAC.3